MGSQVDNKKMISWVIPDFNILQPQKISSDHFTIGGCNWNLTAYPKGDNFDYLSLFISVATYGLLPLGWKRYAKVSFTVVNHFSDSLSQKQELQKWFDEKNPSWGFDVMLPLTLLHYEDSGFLVNGQLHILAEVDVIGDESLLLKEVKQEKQDYLLLSSDLHNNTELFEESFEVYGFRVLSSQVEAVERIFERHPEVASQVRTANHSLKTTYINVLLGIMETLCQSPEELTDDDLKEASMAVSYVANAGFKVDWLEEKIYKLMENKNKVQSGEAQLVELNKKCSDLKALKKKVKEEVALAKVPLMFDDVL